MLVFSQFSCVCGFRGVRGFHGFTALAVCVFFVLSLGTASRLLKISGVRVCKANCCVGLIAFACILHFALNCFVLFAGRHQCCICVYHLLTLLLL